MVLAHLGGRVIVNVPSHSSRQSRLGFCFVNGRLKVDCSLWISRSWMDSTWNDSRCVDRL